MKIRKNGIFTLVSSGSKTVIFTTPDEDFDKGAVAEMEKDTIYYCEDVDGAILIQLAKQYPNHRFIKVEKLSMYIGD